MRGLRIVALPFILALTVCAAETDPRLQVVQKLVEAFNAQDVDAMAAQVTEDIEWLSIRGAAISVEAKGKQALREGMASYFESLPTVRSVIESPQISGKYVILRERVHWDQGGSQKSQSSLAIYEIEEGLIARVWYFPAEE